MPKDKVVFRSDVSSADKTPFMKAPRKVRDYFSQYGPCEVDWSTHSSRGGMEKYAVVLKFEQPAIANKIKQKYNGRALFGARITTSWLDDRQARDLGIPPSQPERPMRRSSPDSTGRGRRGRSLSRARGRRHSPLFPLSSQEKEASTSRCGADAELHDSSSESSLSFNLEKRNRSPSPLATTKIHSMTRLERSSRLSPVSTPRAASPIKERSDVLERPESRTSSHSSKERERESLQGDRNQTSPRHSTRLRSKRRMNSDDDKSPPRSTESRPSKGRKDSSSRLYVPRSKRVKDESEEGNTSDEKKRTIFDRLGPTLEQQEKQYQLEAYGDTNGSTTPPVTALKGRKSSETFVSPDRGGLKSPTFESTSRHSSISSGSERETKVPPPPPPPVSPHSETESKSRRDSKHGSSRKERSRRESKGSSKDGSRKSSRSRRERDRDHAARKIVKDAQPVSQPYEQSGHHPHSEIDADYVAHRSPQHQPIDHDIPSTAMSVIATADMPTTTIAKVPVSVAEEPITTKVAITTTASKVPITTTATKVPITTTAKVPFTTDKVPITTTAKVPVTTTAKVPITTTAKEPVTTPVKVPVTTTAEVSITTATVPIATTAKVRITTTEVTITKEPPIASATEFKPLPVAVPDVPDGGHPVEPPVDFDEKDETPPPEVLEASGGMYRGYAAQWYQAMYNDPYALQQYVQSYYQQQQQQQQMLQMGAEQQQARTDQQQTQARTDQQQMQPEWQLQRMKTEKQELGPMQQMGPVQRLGPLMQQQILPEPTIHLEQQPTQQQVWRHMWPEQQQPVKQMQSVQRQTWPLQPVLHQTGSLQPVHHMGLLQQQVHPEKQQQQMQPLQRQMQPLQQHIQPLQQQTWPLRPVHRTGSLHQQVQQQKKQQTIQPLQRQMQPLQQQTWPLQQQLQPVLQTGSLQQQQQRTQPQFQPLEQHVWPPKQPVHQVESLTQQVKTEHMEQKQRDGWIPDEVAGYRMQQSDSGDSDSGEQADERDAFSMEQMYQALQNATNNNQTEEGAANATLLDEKTSETPTAQMSQTSSAKEDNIPRLTAPVEKRVVSEVGVQCAVTPSLPAVPSIPTKATTGTQTGPSVKSTCDTKEGELEKIWSSATGSLRRAKRKRKMGAKYKSLQKSTMEDFAQQAEPILIMTKLLVSQNPSNRAVLLRSMEASLWQVVHTLGSKFAEKTGEDS